MYKVINSIEALYQEIENDKNWTGAEVSTRNRYPVRFVLFDSFCDFNNFAQECSSHNVYVQGIDKWLPKGSDDKLITYTQLVDRFEEYIKSLPANDFLIAPFSEIARFYDNEDSKEFDSLVKTIRLISSPEEAQADHQRIYIPIIGMQGKMNNFRNDPNIHIWEYQPNEESRKYKLILTRGNDYGVRDLETGYSICKNVREWITLWKVGNNVKQRIISTSKTLFDNANHALPDNAFEHVVCHNAFDFLTTGLALDFGDASATEEDMPYWEQLAESIDVFDFNFDNYVCMKFNSLSLNDEKDFVQAWFESHDDFSRWTLKTYFLYKYKDSTYLCRALRNCNTLSTSELFSQIATLIFDEVPNTQVLNQRLVLMKEAASHSVQITEEAERKLEAKLKAIATDPERGYYHAMKYMSALTSSEKQLMIEWLGSGNIERKSLQDLFPSLYDYTAPNTLNVDSKNLWINTYFEEYRKSKIANQPTDILEDIIKEKNSSATTFEQWHDNFKTVKTILHNRQDIDVYYWIDGFGVDWIPYFVNVIKQHKVDGVYLNEVYVGIAELPTCTDNNKIKLEELSNYNLKKIGDLDTYAHSQKKFPSYIIKEFGIMEEAINSVLAHYNGKKIAFVSDHGITYLSQLATGLKMGGIDSHHEGRCGTWKAGSPGQDDNYIVVGNDNAVCSLSHKSLTSKTPDGHGAHGGATPEEVLVPIIIVSSQKNASCYSAKLLENNVSATSPVLQYEIKGVNAIDKVSVTYNGIEHILHKTGTDIFESERLALVETSTRVTLKINNFIQTDTIVIKTGVDEEDLFGGL